VQFPKHNGFVIITADSVGGMLDIHNRQPVTLSPELACGWRDPATPQERAEQMVLLQGEPAEAFEWFKVDRAVGNASNRQSDMIEPIDSFSGLFGISISSQSGVEGLERVCVGLRTAQNEKAPANAEARKNFFEPDAQRL
jgi:hypothetical protein